MVVSPYLEKLIWEGKAVFKVANIGGSTRNVIEVPDNVQLVITSITFYPPLDGNESDPSQYMNRRLFQATIFNSRSSYSYLFRSNNSFSQIEGSGQLGNPGEPITYQTYMVFKDSFVVNFILGGSLINSTTGYASPEGFSKQPPVDFGSSASPVRYQTIVSSDFVGAVTTMNLIPGGTGYIPPTSNNPYSFSLLFPIDPNTALSDPYTLQGMPIMVLSYVEIKMNSDNTTQSQ